MKRIVQILLVLAPWVVCAQPEAHWDIACGEEYELTAVAEDGYRFVQWSDGNTDNPRMITATENMEVEAVFERVASDIVVIEDKKSENLQNIAGTNPVIVVEKGGELTVDAPDNRSGVITIHTDGTHSGQVHNAGQLGTNWRIVLEYILNPNGTTASPDLWYAFSVPFQVDIESGITRATGSSSHVSGTDFLIMEYDENQRATTGKGWKKILSGILEPGNIYMIGIAGDCNNWLFEKKEGASAQGNNKIPITCTGDGSNANQENKGWNGMGNPQLENMYISSNRVIDYIVVYNNLIDDYETRAISEIGSICVGQAFFVQTYAGGNMTFSANPPSVKPLPALKAVNKAVPMMHFTLADKQHGLYIDHMYLTMHDDAAETYTIGRDVARMDGGNKRIQKFWCTNVAGMHLAAHDIVCPATETVVNLGIYTPADGEYTLDMNGRAMDEYEVELLRQGSHMAVLYDAQPVALNLKAGTTNDYSVRLRRKMPTGLDEVASDQVQCTKVLIDGRLYILQGAHIYDAQGKAIK